MIPDNHIRPENWGMRPVLFYLNGVPVSSYSVIILVAIIVAIGLFFYLTRSEKRSEHSGYIILAAIVGGILGAKIPIWVANIGAIVANPNINNIFAGRTIVGGIVGGALTVWLVKKKYGLKQRIGNFIVPSLSLGIAIGRLGCFLAGCCFGKPTSLPWGVNFGDEVLRHPTQLYEAVFMFGFFIFSLFKYKKMPPGKLFDLFMVTYFSFRFLVEFIRVNEVFYFGLTYYQIASLFVLVYYLFIKKAFLREQTRTQGTKTDL